MEYRAAEAERRLRAVEEQIDRRMNETRQALEEMNRKRIAVLEQLLELQLALESVPSLLHEAYREADVGFIPAD